MSVVKKLALWVGGIALAYALLTVIYVMSRTSWWVAGQPADNTGEIAAQAGLLLASVQTVVSFVVAAATIAYVVLTNRMVGQVRADAADRVRSDERAAIDSLAGGALTTAAQSVILARGLGPQSLAARFGSGRRAREMILLAGFVRVTDAMSEITRAGETVKSMRPDVAAEVNAVLDVATDAFEDAMAGRVAPVEAAAPKIRAAIDALKAAASEART
jgi:hypothetical protein